MEYATKWSPLTKKLCYFLPGYLKTNCWITSRIVSGLTRHHSHVVSFLWHYQMDLTYALSCINCMICFVLQFLVIPSVGLRSHIPYVNCELFGLVLFTSCRGYYINSTWSVVKTNNTVYLVLIHFVRISYDVFIINFQLLVLPVPITLQIVDIATFADNIGHHIGKMPICRG